MATKNKINIEFKPKQVTKRLLSVLESRAQDVLVSRYGLGKNTDRMTLEAIGKKYNITRERVRQIENHALNNIRKSDTYKKELAAFEELEKLVYGLGSIVAEDDLLEYLSSSKGIQNHIHFLLVTGQPFLKQKEDKEFRHRWHVDEDISNKIHTSLQALYENLSDDELIPEADMIKQFLEHVKDVSDEYKNDEIVKRWLSLSKKIGRNPLGEWGRAESPNVNTKGMRDYAFLVIRKHGSPIHFREVAKAIEETFNRKAHVATTHNELIKDARFVLVGRGLYALREWGYVSGVVRDVIKDIIKQAGPLSREEIIEKVMKERYVKENTIMVNLQNPKYFKKDASGKYSIAG